MPKPGILIAVSVSIFVFLVLLGLISGNTFLVILGRSITGTLFLMIVIFAALAVLKKIFSDVPQPGSGGKVSHPDAENDSEMLDIVLDRENPYEEGKTGASEFDISESVENEEEMPAGSSVNFVEEVEEESLGDIGFLDTLDSDEDVVEVMNDNADINESFRKGGLPEIDNQSVVFDSANVKSLHKKGNEAMNVLGDNVDAGSMAKAIKTILTRDHKG